MSLPSTPPYYGPAGSAAAWRAMLAPIVVGDTGWRAYAVQAVLRYDTPMTLDGAFGPKTQGAVKAWQLRRDLTADGVVGPRTQSVMLRSAEAAIHSHLPALPLGLLWGFVVSEGASILAATNPYTPPGGAPGVDCGPVQWRQYAPFSVADLIRAFDARQALEYAGLMLLNRQSSFRSRRPSLTAARALELAVLAHNAPFLADQFVRYGHLLKPDAIAYWTTKPGGGHYTYAEWAVEYPRRIMQFVA